MYITRKHISRRTLLRGAGASIALPLLDAMIPAATSLAATAAAPKPRLGYVYFPHGAIMEKWKPEKVGKDFELSEILQPLQPFQETAYGRQQYRQQAGGESRGPCPCAGHVAVVRASTGRQLRLVVASRPTRLPRRKSARTLLTPRWRSPLRRVMESAVPVNAATVAASPALFRSGLRPLRCRWRAIRVNLFLRLFGQGDSPEERRFYAQQTASLLDMVTAETTQLQRRIGARDRVVLDEYLESVREIERRVQNSSQGNLSGLQLPETPGANSHSFDEHLNLLFDLTALAWQGDLTRVFTFMVGPEVSEQTYNHIGVPDAFHALSHHANDQAKKDRLVLIQKYHTKVFAKFLGKLAAMPDGDGTMLDHASLLYGSNMSNSNAHNQYPLPNVLVGGGCGKVRGGQHIDFPERTPLANLLLTMLQRADVRIESLGDSNGTIAQV